MKKKRQSASQPVSQSASQPVSQSASQPVSQSASQPVSQSASQPVSQSASKDHFPIVGIGASAGGLKAFEAFFSGMPADTDPGMAFVLVQHLAPDHTSLLRELVQRYTRMEVFEVEDGMAVRINCVYIIPPGHDMALLNGKLQLLEPAAGRGQRLPIDFFFRSLAQDQHERAIGIVLSGTASDGTLGVRAIKGEGGMVMAQTPESAEFDGMPRSAITTGLVDYELPPTEMPSRLISYFAHAFGILPRTETVIAPKVESAMQKICLLIRNATGHDFSQYKPSTTGRRIERRMAVHQIGSPHSYVKFLGRSPAEVEALFRDLLIGVTNFFRDPEVFKLLEGEVVPRLFEGNPAVVRAWVAGCSTGEEAYSLAILLAERMEAMRRNCTVQVFATDIDSRAIAAARVGLYPASIAADITPERLARFFTPEPDSSAYRIHKGIRDMVIFSEQDVIKDPPFSKLDLISCRNLLIYLGADLQKRLIPLFHYALKPGGMLCLGTSETVGEFGGLFVALDRKAKVYRRKDDSLRTLPSIPLIPPPQTAVGEAASRLLPAAFPAKQPLRELTERGILQHVVAVGALVNSQGDILYVQGHSGMFLELATGNAGISNILKMAREGLRLELSSALHKAAKTGEAVHCPGLRVKTNGHFTKANLTVRPQPGDPPATDGQPLFLVILEEVPSDTPDKSHTPDTSDTRIAALERELHAREEYIQSAHEELETSTEELQSSNEEMQSVNEELQATNEELETAKEEMQSVNEELSTVNNELQTKVAGLSQSNNDMNNLLAGTGIGTVFVDFNLRILRFTPAAVQIINLIPSDVGRPVAHTVTNLVDYTGLAADMKAVLDTLVPKEVDVRTTEGRWYLLRIQPYRTLDNVIEGAVLTFTDITAMKHAQQEILRLAVVVRDAHDAITVQDLDGHTLAWNPGAVRMYGWTEAEALLLNVRDRIPPDLRESALAKLAQLSRAEIIEPYSTQRISKDGSVKDVSIISTALVNEAGQMYAIATTERTKGAAP